MHAISSYRGTITDPQTNTPTNIQTQTHRQDRLQYTARAAS